MSTLTRGVTVLSSGLLTTVQDTGRWGYQRFGVAVSGAMDVLSHRLANLLVHNSTEAATLEVTLIGPKLRFDTSSIFAVTGAAFDLWLDHQRVRSNVSHLVHAGQTLTFGRCRRGARAYVAVSGGFDTPLVLGSRSTHVASRMGGLAGRALRAGDLLPVGSPDDAAAFRAARRPPVFRLPTRGARLRVIMGPDDDAFDGPQRKGFCSTRFVISASSDRMGYRLDGPPLQTSESGERISTAVSAGSIQLPRDGHPILLMADHQTAGGYPRVATLISADLPRAAQLRATDWVEFEPCTHEAALRAQIAQERCLLS